TKFPGMHWVECFVVKNGVCVARSGEFVVNIE
ncbi:nucleotide-binding domain-containing protein, partial [Gimesia chilikensis]